MTMKTEKLFHAVCLVLLAGLPSACGGNEGAGAFDETIDEGEVAYAPVRGVWRTADKPCIIDYLRNGNKLEQRTPHPPFRVHSTLNVDSQDSNFVYATDVAPRADNNTYAVALPLHIGKTPVPGYFRRVSDTAWTQMASYFYNVPNTSENPGRGSGRDGGCPGDNGPGTGKPNG